MVLHARILGDEVEEVVLADDAAKRVDDALKLVKRRLRVGECRRLAERGEAVVFDLANALAGYTPLLADRLERHALSRGAKTEAGFKHGTRALRQGREELFDDRLGLKSGLVCLVYHIFM